VTRKVTLQEIAAREDTEEAADQDLDQDRQDGIETETIEDEEAEPQTDTTETGDTTEKDETGTEAEGLLPIQDLTKGVLEAEEAIEEIGTETTTEETVIEQVEIREIDTLMRIDVEVVIKNLMVLKAEELVPEMEVKSLFIRKGHTHKLKKEKEKKEVNLEEEVVTEERIESLEEKDNLQDLDPDLQATAEKTQKDLEANREVTPVPTSAVKEIKTVPKEKTTIMPPASTKEIVNFLKDLEIMVTQIKTIMKIKAESLLKTKTKTTSE